MPLEAIPNLYFLTVCKTNMMCARSCEVTGWFFAMSLWCHCSWWLDEIHKTWYGRYCTGDYATLIFFNFFQLLIPIWLMHKAMIQKDNCLLQCHHPWSLVTSDDIITHDAIYQCHHINNSCCHPSLVIWTVWYHIHKKNDDVIDHTASCYLSYKLSVL